MTQRSYQRETFIILALVILVVRIVYELRAQSWAAMYVPVTVAVVLIYVPVLHGMVRHERLDYIERTWAAWKTGLIWFVIASLVIIPTYMLANTFWQAWVNKTVYSPRGIPDFGWILLDQLFLISLAEEIFFRGWLQSRLKKFSVSKWPVLGAKLGWPWLLTAILFAISHSLITVQWWHFAIFFPALVFGWLREKTGGIVAPTLFHCACNLTAIWIQNNYI